MSVRAVIEILFFKHGLGWIKALNSNSGEKEFPPDEAIVLEMVME